MSYEITKEGVRIEHSVRLTKPAIRSLQEDKVAAQMQAIVAATLTGQRVARGWAITIDARHGANGRFTPIRDYNRSSAISGEYIYHVFLYVVCTPQTPRKGLDTEFKNILNSIDAKARNLGNWILDQADNKPWSASQAIEENTGGDVGYTPLEVPSDFSESFSHLYGLESQIAVVEASLRRFEANPVKRFHNALIGPPGCGKSDLCQSVKRAIGEDSVLEFDATATTMAGAQKELSEREELPRVLIIEEIEKVLSDNALTWLLGVLDLRGEIRKTTARANILRDTRMLAIATVNDEEAFNKLNFGALASRFMNKIHFQRPSRELLQRIVLREIESIKGNPAWAKPTLDYCEEMTISDPREVIAIALCGAESLLDGSYQKHLRNTRGKGWEA